MLGFAAGAQAQATLSISGPASAPEGDSSYRDLTYTITLSQQASRNFGYTICFTGTATYGVALDGSTSVGDDYHIRQSNVPIGENSTTGCRDLNFGPTALTGLSNTEITIRVEGDTDAESDETVIATLSLRNAPSDVTLSTSTHTHTIEDDDRPVITIAGGSAVTEGTSATFTVTSTPAPTSALTVKVKVSQTGNFTIPGNLGDKTLPVTTSGSADFTIQTTDDSTDEANGSLTVVLKPGTGYRVGSPDAATIAVNDDDTATVPTLSISPPASADEGDSGTTLRYFTVSLSDNLPSGFLLWKVCFSGTATIDTSGAGTIPASADYQPVTGTIRSSSNCTNRNFSTSDLSYTSWGIRVKGDADVEQDETVIATLTIEPGGTGTANLGTSVATHTIRNDDSGTVVDTTPPRVASIARRTPATSPTDADSLTWRVTFDEAVTGVDAADFTVSGTTAGLTASQVSGTNAWDVTATGGDLAGLAATTVSLGLANNQDITDTASNPLTNTTPTGANESYVVDNAAAAPFLTLTPAEITAASLDGATIRLVPKNSTFFGAGGGDGLDPDGGGAEDYEDLVHMDDLVSSKVPGTPVRLSAAGLGRITLSGAPDGLSIASGRLLARQTGAQAAHGTKNHRAVEITLAHDGSAITADETVTITVRGGAGGLLRPRNGTGSRPPDLSARFTIRAGAAPPPPPPPDQPPTVVSISHRAATADSITWRVVFSEKVRNVDADDFTTEPAAALAVTPEGVAATAWDVTATGEGLAMGEVRLGIRDGSDIEDADGNRLADTIPAGEDESLWRGRDRNAGTADAALSGFGRAMGGQVVEAITARLRDAGTPGLSGSIAGHELAPAAGAPAWPVSRREITIDELMDGTGLAATTAGEDGMRLAFWGRAVRAGATAPAWDGHLASLIIGADAGRDDLRIGLALARSRGRGEADGANATISLASLIPYGGWQVSDNLHLWAAAGAGRGKLAVTPGDGQEIEADAGWRLVAAGLRAVLLRPAEGMALDAWADGLVSTTRSEAAEGMAAASARTTRLRAGIEGSRVLETAAGRLASRLSVAMRHDGGDGAAGTGIELGAGLGWQSTGGLALTLDGSRVSGHDDLEAWQLAAGMAYDPRPETRRGLSASMRHAVGASSSGAGWQTGLAWGTPREGGMVGSSYLQLRGEAEAADARIGWRLEPDIGAERGMRLDLWTGAGIGAGQPAVGLGLVWPFE